MKTRKAEAVWQGKLQSGSGKVMLGSGTYAGMYSFDSRFEQGEGTNPEELIGAAHAGCFSMALAHELEESGFAPQRIHTKANVTIDKAGDGFHIPTIELITEAAIPEIDEQTFQQHAETAKANCPVSKALAGAEIKLQATLI